MKHYEKCWCGSGKKYKKCHMIIDSCHEEAIEINNVLIRKENQEFRERILRDEGIIREKYNNVDQEKRDYWKEFSIRELKEVDIINEEESNIFLDYNTLIEIKNEKRKSERLGSLFYQTVYMNSGMYSY